MQGRELEEQAGSGAFFLVRSLYAQRMNSWGRRQSHSAIGSFQNNGAALIRAIHGPHPAPQGTISCASAIHLAGGLKSVQTAILPFCLCFFLWRQRKKSYCESLGIVKLRMPPQQILDISFICLGHENH
jgi:hypothetical protein